MHIFQKYDALLGQIVLNFFLEKECFLQKQPYFQQILNMEGKTIRYVKPQVAPPVSSFPTNSMCIHFESFEWRETT